jgi:hypothetical protein
MYSTITSLLVGILLFNSSVFGQNWVELGTGSSALNPNGDIYVMCFDRHNNIYAAGEFWSTTDTSQMVVKWDGTSWSQLGTTGIWGGLPNQIQAICCDTSGNIYIGGEYWDRGGNTYVAKWDGITWSEVRGVSSVLHGGVLSLSCDRHGNLYAAGVFRNAGGYCYVAKWDGSSWSEVGAGIGALNANGVINAIFIDTADNIYAAGTFTDDLADTSGNLIVEKWNGVSWTKLGSSGVAPLNHEGQIFSITGDLQGNVYASGYFTNSSGYDYVAKWDGTAWSELGTGGGALNANSSIFSLCFDTSKNLHAAGNFTNASGHTYVAKWDGTGWTELGSGSYALNADNSIFSICADLAGNIYAGGGFLDTSGHSYVAKYNNPALTGIVPLHRSIEISVFPNPTGNELNVTGLIASAKYRVSNALGATVSLGALENGSNTIFLGGIAAGVYILEVNDGGQHNIFRVVKE